MAVVSPVPRPDKQNILESALKKALNFLSPPVVSGVPHDQRVMLKNPQEIAQMRKPERRRMPQEEAVKQATTTPIPSPTPFARFITPQGVDLAQGEVADKIRKTFSEDPETAVAIGIGESSLNPKARNTIPERNIDAIGLMQINLPVHMDKVPGDTYEEKAQNLMNPDINLEVARRIKNESKGWGPWEAFTAGMAQEHLVQPE